MSTIKILPALIALAFGLEHLYFWRGRKLVGRGVPAEPQLTEDGSPHLEPSGHGISENALAGRTARLREENQEFRPSAVRPGERGPKVAAW
ncbi:MAG: hypothetical protein C0502_11540 [Opitutus sp.]|nr:hypothetical protein [Opitutus sp.]